MVKILIFGWIIGWEQLWSLFLTPPPSMYPLLKTKLQSVIVNGRWQLLPSLLNYPTVADRILKITLSVTPLLDNRDWTHASNGILTSKLAFQFLSPTPAKLDWASIIWRACIPPSHSFLFWRCYLSSPRTRTCKGVGVHWFRFVVCVISKLKVLIYFFLVNLC